MLEEFKITDGKGEGTRFGTKYVENREEKKKMIDR